MEIFSTNCVFKGRVFFVSMYIVFIRILEARFLVLKMSVSVRKLPV